MLDEILNSKGASWDDLTPDEKKSVSEMVKAIQGNALTLEKVRDAVLAMKSAVEQELVKTDEFVYFLWFKRVNRQHIYLKARLQNYLLLEAFLISPKRAKEELENAIGNLTRKLSS